MFCILKKQNIDVHFLKQFSKGQHWNECLRFSDDGILVVVAVLFITVAKIRRQAHSLFIFFFFLQKCTLLGCKIFNVLKIKFLNMVSEETAVALNLKSSLFTGCILYPLENDTKWQ